MIKAIVQGLFGSEETEKKKSGGDEIELQQVEWTEEKEYEYPKLTERVVWSGGVEETITHVKFPWCYGYRDWVDENEDPILDVYEEPAYTETLGEDTYTEVKTETKYAWIDGSIPERCEPTGKTKVVTEALE